MPSAVLLPPGGTSFAGAAAVDDDELQVLSDAAYVDLLSYIQFKSISRQLERIAAAGQSDSRWDRGRGVA